MTISVTFMQGIGANMQSIKVTDMAHKALQLLRAMEDKQQSKFASIAIIEAIERDYPKVYTQVREWALSIPDEEQVEIDFLKK
jgi:uncharacterized membrane protein